MATYEEHKILFFLNEGLIAVQLGRESMNMYCTCSFLNSNRYSIWLYNKNQGTLFHGQRLLTKCLALNWLP